MKTVDIKDDKQQYIRVLSVKKMSKNQLLVCIVGGINAEDMDMEKTKVLCHVKILFGIKTYRFRKEVKMC